MKKKKDDRFSSFSIIKGAMIRETYTAFQNWDWNLSAAENVREIKESNCVGATSAGWLHYVVRILKLRYRPEEIDKPLVELAQAGCDYRLWKPLLLWHMTREEFLLRDFLQNWLFERYQEGVCSLNTKDVLNYFQMRAKKYKEIGNWTPGTRTRVAQALLKMAVDFDLMSGKVARKFVSFHLPDASFIYLLHAIAQTDSNAMRIVRSPDWRMYLMPPEDIERELFRLHQYRKLHYEVAGSLAQLKLPYATPLEYIKEMIG